MAEDVKAPLLAELPYSQSILPVIMKRDPMPYAVQGLLLVVTTLMVTCFIPPSSLILGMSFGLDMDWDQKNAVSQFSQAGFSNLFAVSLGLSTVTLQFIGGITLLVFAMLGLADISGAQWPLSWQTCNSKCYDEMFMEPTRKGCLVGRLGNTYSNCLYLFHGLCVLSSATSTDFWASDAMFGVMLLLLALFSVIWHASNAPKAHYLDLWAMDACIAYLNVKSLGLWANFSSLPRAAGPVGTAIIFGAMIVMSLRDALRKFHGSGPLDNCCSFSGRHRLMNEGAKGNTAMRTSGVCLFIGMPLLFMIVPSLLQVCFAGATGSIFASTVAWSSLVVGWSLRMFERFALDGWGPMNFILRGAEDHPSKLQLLFAAFVSPTAILHSFTGVTLLFAYAWTRSLEQVAGGSSTCAVSA